MQTFYNERLGLAWSNAQDRSTAQDLMARADCVPRVVPDWALVVTMSVDTQDNRLEAQVHAWGPGLEQAVIDHQVFMGSPAKSPDDPKSVWAKLGEYRRTPWQHASGATIYASVYAIDSGGHHTQDVYNYGAARAHLGCVVIRGKAGPVPIIPSVPSKADIDWRGKRMEGGVKLWNVGVDTCKDHLHNRMRLAEGHGAMHFSTALSLDWFEQLLGEHRVRKRMPTGVYKTVWSKHHPSDPVEALDNANYNLACAHFLGVHKWSALDWARLRKKLGVDEVPPANLYAGAAAPVTSPVSIAVPPQPAATARRMISRGQY
jgi:phage terminase large subunit GpA-like protein